MGAMAKTISILFLAAVIACSPLAGAQADHDGARSAVKSGDIRPLGQIMSAVSRRVPGEILDAKLNRGSKPWTYSLKVLTQGGNVRRVKVDATTGRILSVK